MKIRYVIGKKIYEEDYFPREKVEYIVREEEYFFDAALQLEMDKIYRMHEDEFMLVDNVSIDGIKEYQLILPKKKQDETDIESGELRARIEKLIRLYVVAPECISGMKDNLEQLYEAHRETMNWHNSLEVDIRERIDDFQMHLLSFVDRVEQLLIERNSLIEPLENWDAEMPIYADVPYVSIEKYNDIINGIQEMIRGSYDDTEKYRGKINNSVRKNFIRNKLSQIPNIFNERVSLESKLLRQAKKAVLGRSVSQLDSIKMLISADVFEQKSDEVERTFLEKINESAECPCSFEDLENEETYIELIKKLEDNIHKLILLSKNGRRTYFNKSRCVALFDLNETTRLFSLSGLMDFNGTFDNNHVCWEPANKVYNVLSEDVAHNYVWCRLTPAVKRYLHRETDNSIQELATGASFEMLSNLITGTAIPREIGGDFSCCERKIFAYFENNLSQCDCSPTMITRWAPCELCKPAINALYNRNIIVNCYYIWRCPSEYEAYLKECAED